MKNFKQLLVFASIIVITGMLGGFGNYYIENSNGGLNSILEVGVKNHKECPPFFDLMWDSCLGKSIILGIIASGVVPLFLHVISSNLLDINDKQNSHINYLIFASFCLLASIFSDNFLDSAYNSVFEKEVSKIKEIAISAKKNADAALVHNIPENEPDEGVAQVARIREFGFKKQEEAILTDLVKDRKMYKSAVIEKTKDDAAIEKLINNGLIEELSTEYGKILSLTKKVARNQDNTTNK